MNRKVIVYIFNKLFFCFGVISFGDISFETMIVKIKDLDVKKLNFIVLFLCFSFVKFFNAQEYYSIVY